MNLNLEKFWHNQYFLQNLSTLKYSNYLHTSIFSLVKIFTASRVLHHRTEVPLKWKYSNMFSSTSKSSTWGVLRNLFSSALNYFLNAAASHGPCQAVHFSSPSHRRLLHDPSLQSASAVHRPGKGWLTLFPTSLSNLPNPHSLCRYWLTTDRNWLISNLNTCATTRRTL